MTRSLRSRTLRSRREFISGVSRGVWDVVMPLAWRNVRTSSLMSSDPPSEWKCSSCMPRAGRSWVKNVLS